MRKWIADALFLLYIHISVSPIISSDAEKNSSNVLEMLHYVFAHLTIHFIQQCFFCFDSFTL